MVVGCVVGLFGVVGFSDFVVCEQKTAKILPLTILGKGSEKNRTKRIKIYPIPE